MKKLFIEDREVMEWIRVTMVSESGKPSTNGERKEIPDNLITKFVKWCEENNYNWMITERVN